MSCCTVLLQPYAYKTACFCILLTTNTAPYIKALGLSEYSSHNIRETFVFASWMNWWLVHLSHYHLHSLVPLQPTLSPSKTPSSSPVTAAPTTRSPSSSPTEMAYCPDGKSIKFLSLRRHEELLSNSLNSWFRLSLLSLWSKQNWLRSRRPSGGGEFHVRVFTISLRGLLQPAYVWFKLVERRRSSGKALEWSMVNCCCLS